MRTVHVVASTHSPETTATDDGIWAWWHVSADAAAADEARRRAQRLRVVTFTAEAPVGFNESMEGYEALFDELIDTPAYDRLCSPVDDA